MACRLCELGNPPPAGTTIELNFTLEPQLESPELNQLMSSTRSVIRVIQSTHSLLLFYATLYSCAPFLCRKYGAHPSKVQVADHVAPHKVTLKLVDSWPEHHGFPSSISKTHGCGCLTLTGIPVSQASNPHRCGVPSLPAGRNEGLYSPHCLPRSPRFRMGAYKPSRRQCISPHYTSRRRYVRTPVWQQRP